MDNGTYYCILDQRFGATSAGVYKVTMSVGQRTIPRYFVSISDKVWFQGPRGGVKIKKDRSGLGYTGYLTNDPEFMKEFMWVKLKARAVN